jgi:DNA-directed RNA polymerase subunit RPC12/RpoP
LKQDVSKLVGICGLYCGTCPSYLAERKNDVEYIERMSRERAARCPGCGETLYWFDHECPDCQAQIR